MLTLLPVFALMLLVGAVGYSLVSVLGDSRSLSEAMTRFWVETSPGGRLSLIPAEGAMLAFVGLVAVLS